LELPLGPIVSIVRGLIDAVRDRPSVYVQADVRDHGHPEGVITPWVGEYVHLEVHATGPQPVRVTGVGLELEDRSALLFESGDRLPKTIERPDVLQRLMSVDNLREKLGGRAVRRLVVTASPNRSWRRPLPKEWRAGIPGI
jgi:hypothetical protein